MRHFSDNAKQSVLQKARRAEAGVRMLFAVGGWDNSQHFSAIAADASKRRRFVDSCADFLKVGSFINVLFIYLH